MTAPTAEIVHVPFRDEHFAAVLVNGKPHIVLRPFIDRLGIDYSNQIRKLRPKSWATVVRITTVAADGKVREMDAVDVRTFLMLLAGIDENRVAASAKELLVAYQKEVADVIEAYFADGGAINPRASDEQLAALADELEHRRAVRAKWRIELLAAMDGVDPTWKDSRQRHEYAIVVAEKPDIAPENLMLMVEPYLREKGIPNAKVKSLAMAFGKIAKKAYKALHGHFPETVPALVAGRERPVCAYFERDRPFLDAIFIEHYVYLLPPVQLELTAA